MLNKIFKLIENAVRMRCYTAAQDRQSPPATIIDAGSGALVLRGKVGTNEFKNIVATLRLGHNDSVSGVLFADFIYTRTTAIGDSNYEALPIGSINLFQSVTSRAVVDAQWQQLNIYGFGNILVGNRDNIITALATLAQGTAAGRWAGLRVKSTIPTGVDLSAVEQHGIYVETELVGTGKCSSHYGMKIETYVTSGATISADHYGIGVFTYDDRAGSNQLHVARLEHNGANVGNAFLGLFCATTKITYLIESSTTDDPWMSIGTTPTCATAGGWYRVRHGGYTRYIQLWQSVS